MTVDTSTRTTHITLYDDDNTIFNHEDVVTVTVDPIATKIRNCVFKNCTSLTTVETPPNSSITKIGNHAFYACSSLATIDIPNTVTSIGDHAFQNCHSLKTIVIPNSVTHIGNEAFESCTSLEVIHIPKSVVSIGNDAFSECHSLTTIKLHSLLKSFSDYIFFGCSSLTSIKIPNTVISIGNYAFYQCTSLTTIHLPESVTDIGHYAFSGCSSLKSINVPDKVESIKSFAFHYCSSLSSINIPNSVKHIADFAFFKCSKLNLIALPQSVTQIRNGAFGECDALQQRQTDGFNYDADIHKWLRRRFKNLPIHQVFYESTNTMTTTLLKNVIKECKSILISTDAMLMTPLHVLCCSPIVTAEMIQLLKTASPDAVSMTNVFGETPLMMYLKCKNLEYNAFYTNEKQLKPLTKLLEMGIKQDIMKIILLFYDETLLVSELEKRNETSGLLPFMSAGLLSECGLDVVYELAMQRPKLLIGNKKL
jgi:hypothetical protein